LESARAKPVANCAVTAINTVAGFNTGGDPASANGAIWTYAAQVAGVTYDLQGILMKPTGPGSFPAVIISHGAVPAGTHARWRA
jgi:hypothetical protein